MTTEEYDPPCSAMLEVHYFIRCQSRADGARQLRELADEIESTKAVQFVDGEEVEAIRIGSRTGCDRLKNRKEWLFQQND